MRRTVSTLVSAVAVLSAATGCGSEDDREVLVLAASSLTDVFTMMEADFEAAHPDIDVTVSFAASSTLRVQVEEGAPADVVALADMGPMDRLAADRLVVDPIEFATNSIVLAVPADNPGRVGSIDDLADPDLLVGVCAAQVPCGGYAQQVLSGADVGASFGSTLDSIRASQGRAPRHNLPTGSSSNAKRVAQVVQATPVPADEVVDLVRARHATSSLIALDVDVPTVGRGDVG